MKLAQKNKIIVFITFSDFNSGNKGDAVNDRKLYNTIPKYHEKKAIYPKYSANDKLTIKSILLFFIRYFLEILKKDRIFICRAPKLAIPSIILKSLFNNRTIIRMGCSPAVFIERMAFKRNQEFNPKINLVKKLFFLIEPFIEIFSIKHVDGYIVENVKAKKIAEIYGADPTKINIIPYYVQEYFLEGKNPKYDPDSDLFKIGYSGRFSLYDLLTPVINSVSELIHKGCKIKLHLIGDGITKDKMMELVKKNKLSDHIIFLGSMSNQKVSNIINDFHCLLYPMFNICPSTIAIKILEGVMKGKVIITTNSGNNSSLFYENKDLILESNTNEEIIDKLEKVLKNYDYYKEIAEKNSIKHRKMRSFEHYRVELEKLITKLN